MKCRSPSPPAAAAAETTSLASPISSNGRGGTTTTTSNSKRRSSSTSIKMLGSISRVESSSSLSRAGGNVSSSANNNINNNQTSSQLLMQPLLDDDLTTTSSSRMMDSSHTATNSFIPQRYYTTKAFSSRSSSKSNNHHPHVEQQQQSTTTTKLQTDLQNLAHRRKLPRPLPPSKCPLLCVFYAEFDIVIGPTVCFQAPHKFMHFDVNVKFEEVHQALEETFQSVIKDGQTNTDYNNIYGENNTTTPIKDDYWNWSPKKDDYWNWSPNKEKLEQENDYVDVDYNADQASQATLPTSSHFDEKNSIGQAAAAALDSANNDNSNNNKAQSSSSEMESRTVIDTISSQSTTVNDVPTVPSTRHHRTPSHASSSKNTMTSNPTPTTTNHEGGDTSSSSIDTELLANSIFAATSEYIITGNELANQTITVSTHEMHILSRPMIICDTERYERNSHLFAVGFVVRRNVDPRPYWPVLSNLSFTLRDMEVESEFLSNERTRPQVQYLLEDVLLSLNSKQRDCHLLLDDANILNLRLFKPPPPPTPPVSDHTVPILLRPEWQVQMFDWDLTINWIIPHIDGCKFLKQIAQSSEVDMELVRACLRVLRHHGVLAHVDIFRYSNVYESTTLGKELLKSKLGDNLIQEAYVYAVKSKNVQKRDRIRGGGGGRRGSTSDLSPSVMSSSPSFNLTASGRLHHPHINSVNSLDLSNHGHNNGPVSNSLGWTSAVVGWARRMDETSSSFPSRTGHLTIAEEEESGDEQRVAPPENLSTSADAVGGGATTPTKRSFHDATTLKEIEPMKNALAQIYASCNRSQSFGEILMKKVSMGNVVVAAAASSKKASASITPSSESLEWQTVFDYFDHRRLITFGVIRGLIKRIHRYPLAYEIIGDNKHDANTEEADNDNGDPVEVQSVMAASDPSEFDLHSHRKTSIADSVDVSVVAAEAATAAQSILDDGSRSRTSSFPASPLLQGISTLPFDSRHSKRKPTKKKPSIEVIALAMNGMRCDDELSCMFDTPVEKLVEEVEKTGRWNVISVFSCTK